MWASQSHMLKLKASNCKMDGCLFSLTLGLLLSNSVLQKKTDFPLYKLNDCFLAEDPRKEP